ncbi:MAG TPA: hypothetical protein GX523_08060 [Desulfitobacterium dehalogenans]|uniref:Uncharacterized protein n=1 Tax=Desulfitobacterium dehalogenans TaxID=36854 RepID=A0A7C6Z452_9FIRM|nr:hypothetical protein [Desulfitobacterium dehalogenans]
MQTGGSAIPRETLWDMPPLRKIVHSCAKSYAYSALKIMQFIEVCVLA